MGESELISFEKFSLADWKNKYEEAKSAYNSELVNMDKNWGQYIGDHAIYNADGTQGKDSKHNRNFTYELIETQVGTNIPLPKVSSPSRDPKKIYRAKIIEAFLREWEKTVPTEQINDIDDRNCKVLGSSFTLTYWDSNKRTNSYVGMPAVKVLHPKQVIPQCGVSEIADMDYIFISYSDTRRNLERTYDVDIEDDNSDDSTTLQNTKETITQITAYYRNDNGRIGVFSWAGNTILQDVEDYNARQDKVCNKCGKSILEAQDSVCSCGCKKFVDRVDEYEEIETNIPIFYETDEIVKEVIPTNIPEIDEAGNPIFEEVEIEGIAPTIKTHKNKIRYYVPTEFPVHNRRNISIYNKFLGSSDVSKIADSQFAYDKLATKVQERLLKGGSIITLPKGTKIETTDKELKVVYIENQAQVSMIGAYPLEPNLSQDIAILSRYYEDARSTLGITDAFQGKPDRTADSGAAKQASIGQASGRLQSKEKLKDAAWKNIYKTVFQLMLAYADEPRSITSTDENGEKKEYLFNRYEFLDLVDGEYVYDDDFIFDIDPTASLIQNRATMWEECRKNLQMGAYGNPQDPKTLIQFWKAMESFGYPRAKENVKRFEDIKEENNPMLGGGIVDGQL